MIRIAFAAAAAAATDRKGVTAAEYAILAVGIVIAVGAAVTAFAPVLKGKLEGIFGT